MSQPVRVRFAPSPTGFMHLGGIRSALFDWLYAQKTKGTFVLRLEDTDRERLVPAAVKQIQDSLHWLGLDWDEGVEVGGPYAPYVQSERLDSYKKAADELVGKGALYPCWCSPERLDKLRQTAQKAGKPFKYDRHCLEHPQSLDHPHVLRFKIPADQTIAWNDAVRGPMEFSSNDLDDFVALKSDGFPTYNFAQPVDDQAMRITHVLRGDEFIPTTPKNLLIYRAFGWPEPVFVHLPQVLGTDRTKLSKRHGAKPVLDYRDEGYLPNAVINFLAGLGWNAGEGSTKEIYSRDELIKAFSLERIQKSPAVFDPERLLWLNGIYIRSLGLDELLKVSRDFWSTAAAKADDKYLKAVLQLVQDRLKTLAELPELTDFFFTDPEVSGIDFKPTKLEAADIKHYLEASLEKLEGKFEAADLEQRFRALAEELKLAKPGPFFQTLRISITGQTASPPLFETMAVLGKNRVFDRLKNALKRL